ncbi:low affinity immunoglobulin epsilon Fc receptor-like [Haliotis rufescens]|uniref:low affinity immunoglobulin epsilon Fc receptor-like n=1 Tax=Haliotis rufescens TaxID=6454 RepID=UPI00201EA92E|nr:low affinity immunoglobulin epsilon Fc receptor-like [Haliotis rufescens]
MAKFGVILACLILRTVFSQTKGGIRGLMSLSEYMDRYIEVKVIQGLAGVKKDMSANDEAFERVIREVNTLTANVQCLKRQEESLRKHVKLVDKEQFLCKQAIEKQQKEFDAKLDLWYAEINITKQLLDLHEESDAKESRISIQETCPDQWTEYQDSCYFLFKFDLEWTQGSYMCGLQGGYLASIESEVENDFIKSYLQTNAHGNSVWIGATDMMTRGSTAGWRMMTL